MLGRFPKALCVRQMSLINLCDSLQFTESFSSVIDPDWDEKALMRSAFDDFYKVLKSFGIRDVIYISTGTRADEALPCKFVLWDAKWLSTYEKNGFHAIIRDRIRDTRPNEPFFWDRPAGINDPARKFFYDALAYHKKRHETSYWFRTSPTRVAGISFAAPNERLSLEHIWAAVGAALILNEKVRAVCSQAYCRKVALTQTEQRYLKLFYQGMTRNEVTLEYDVSQNWVAKTCMSFRRKLNVSSDIAAVAKCVEYDLL